MTQPTAPVTFEHDVKPLFRERDRTSMLRSFDLWSYDDVRANAQAILDRVSDGSMPCDTAWTAGQMGLLSGWIDAGMPA